MRGYTLAQVRAYLAAEGRRLSQQRLSALVAARGAMADEKGFKKAWEILAGGR